MTEQHDSGRRHFLKALGAGTTGSLAGCTDFLENNTSDSTPTETDTDTPTATDKPTPTPGRNPDQEAINELLMEATTSIPHFSDKNEAGWMLTYLIGPNQDLYREFDYKDKVFNLPMLGLDSRKSSAMGSFYPSGEIEDISVYKYEEGSGPEFSDDPDETYRGFDIHQGEYSKFIDRKETNQMMASKEIKSYIDFLEDDKTNHEEVYGWAEDLQGKKVIAAAHNQAIDWLSKRDQDYLRNKASRGLDDDVRITEDSLLLVQYQDEEDGKYYQAVFRKLDGEHQEMHREDKGDITQYWNESYEQLLNE